MKQIMTETFYADIYIAGDLLKIRDVCGEFVELGGCVSITPTEFVYTHGRETGAVVGFINYPRFKSTPALIKKDAVLLSIKLINRCYQGSCSIVMPDETLFISKREVDK